MNDSDNRPIASLAAPIIWGAKIIAAVLGLFSPSPKPQPQEPEQKK